MGDDVVEDNEVLVRSTNDLGSFLRRILMCTGKSCIDPESVPKLVLGRMYIFHIRRFYY